MLSMPEHLEYHRPQTSSRRPSVWLSPLALTLCLISVFLAIVSLGLRINLFEVSVVNESIAGTSIHFVLLILTAPGLVLSMMGVAMAGVLGYYGGALLGQLLVYWPLAALLEYLRRFIVPRRRS